MRRLSRVELGPKWNEGARQLWLALKRNGWDQATATKELGLPGGALNRYLYGVRRPERVWSEKLREELGIATSLWDAPATKVFRPPGAVAAR